MKLRTEFDRKLEREHDVGRASRSRLEKVALAALDWKAAPPARQAEAEQYLVNAVAALERGEP